MAGNKKTATILTGALFAGAAGLLLFAGVGSARAALEYQSGEVVAQYEVYNIGVQLTENGNVVKGDDTLLNSLIPEDEEFLVGKTYNEALGVSNDGDIDEYVRVVVTKYWEDADGNKITALSPDLIELTTVDGWIEVEDSSSPERSVYYKTTPLEVDGSFQLTDTLTVNNDIMSSVSQTSTTDANGYTTITTTYEYDGVKMVIEADVDGVQTNNAEAAIKSAWGVIPTLDENGTLTAVTAE